MRALSLYLPAAALHPGQGRRTVVKQIVNMLNDGDVESVVNFSAFLLSKHLTF